MSHRARLAELKALRASGKKAFDNYKVADVDNLYDEVDEDGYKKVVRERLNQDDFVVDDNGEGYADDGREDWDRVQAYESESEEEAGVRGRPSKAGKFSESITPTNSSLLIGDKAKKSRQEEQAKRDVNDRDISEYFKGANRTQPKPKV